MSADLKSAIEEARSIIEGSRPTLDQRSTALAVIEDLERAAESLRGGELQPSALDREREGRMAAEAAARRLEFVYETTSAIFSSPLDANGRLEKLASLVVPDLADWCVCDLVVDDAVHRLAVRGWSGSHAELAASLEHEYPSNAESLGVVADVLASGEARVIRDRAAGGGGELEALFDAIGAKSWMIVPLTVHARTLGALTFVFAESHRKYEVGDLALAGDLARRTALAIDNAVLIEKLEKAVRARDDMVGVVSHDLRNPLASIKMAATLLADDAKAQNREDRKIGMILRATERVETLLRDLLDVTTLEAGGITLNRSARSVSSILADAVELIQGIAAAASIKVEASGDAMADAVDCDPDRLLQIFSNLLGNAVKFTPKGGTISIAANVAGAMCVFSVEDTGQGIPADALPHVFNRFWQGRSKAREGAGLGLAIAKGLVEAHGGLIDVSSTEGEGTTFRFTIPRAAT